MGHMRRVILFLDITDSLQRLLRRTWLLGQDRGQQQQRLPKGPRWRPFSTRSRARTKK